MGPVWQNMIGMILVAALATLTVAPGTVFGGSPATGTVALSAPAPTGGLLVKLVSASDKLTVPAGVVVPAGATSATFPITTTAVSTQTSALLTAKAGNVSKNVVVLVRP